MLVMTDPASDPRHISSMLTDMVRRVGLRAVFHHMHESIRLEDRPALSACRREHMGHAIAILESLQQEGLISGPTPGYSVRCPGFGPDSCQGVFADSLGGG